ALIYFTITIAGEGQPHLFQLADGCWCMLAHKGNGVLIAQPVGTADGVIHMPLPAVAPTVAKCSINAALCGYGMAACGWNFRDNGSLKYVAGSGYGGAQACATGTDNHHVITMTDGMVGFD